MTTYRNGQILMFKDFMEPGDKEARFVVVEDRGERILVEAICDLPIPPQITFRKAQMILAPEQDIEQLHRHPLYG